MGDKEHNSRALVIASISDPPGLKGTLSQPHLQSTHNITPGGAIMNSKLCDVCLVIFSEMAIFSSMKADSHRRHQPNIKALFKSAEAGCHLCTLLFRLYFPTFFQKDSPLPAYLKRHKDALHAVAIIWKYSTVDDLSQVGNFTFLVHGFKS
jgi:hypothetical protein